MRNSVSFYDGIRSRYLVRLSSFYALLIFLSVFIGFPFTAIVGAVFGAITYRSIETSVTPFAVGFLGEVIFIPLVIGSAFTGGVIGVVQSYILRNLLHQDTRGVAWWAFFSAIGWFMGLSVVLIWINPVHQIALAFMNESMAGVISGAIIGSLGGVIVGIMQGFPLKQNLSHMLIWMVANIVSWALFWLLLSGVIANFFSGWSIS